LFSMVKRSDGDDLRTVCIFIHSQNVAWNPPNTPIWQCIQMISSVLMDSSKVPSDKCMKSKHPGKGKKKFHQVLCYYLQKSGSFFPASVQNLSKTGRRFFYYYWSWRCKTISHNFLVKQMRSYVCVLGNR
jgi:hypothetical protein